MNANQLSESLELDYKTTRHHLDLLCENDVLMTMGDGYGMTYFLTNQMEENLDILEQVAHKAGMTEILPMQPPADTSVDIDPGEVGEDEQN